MNSRHAAKYAVCFQQIKHKHNMNNTGLFWRTNVRKSRMVTGANILKSCGSIGCFSQFSVCVCVCVCVFVCAIMETRFVDGLTQR